MITTLSATELTRYVRLQTNVMFPDRKPLHNKDIGVGVSDALDRLEFCFNKICIQRYCRNSQAQFDHLYSDQYLMFIWFLSSVIWKKNSDTNVVNKLYLLNKALHAFDCSFSTMLPDVFIIVHGAGTVLGKGKYADFFTAYHGCTVGQAHGMYPVLGSGTGLGAGSALLGACSLGKNVSVGAGCTLVNEKVGDNFSVYRNKKGVVTMEETKAASISAEYFFRRYLD